MAASKGSATPDAALPSGEDTRAKRLRQLQRRADKPGISDSEREQLLLEAEAIEAGNDQDAPAPAPQSKEPKMPSMKFGGGDAAGVVLGFFAWIWIVLPAITNGTDGKPAGLTGSRNVLRAKFMNIGPDGKALP